MRKYTAKECSCWCNYPNPMHKKSNGQWKCVDCYREARKGDGYRQKTKCVLAEKMEGVEYIMVDLVSRKAVKEAISKAVRNNTLHYEITMVDDVMRVIDNVYSFPPEELTLSESLAYESGKRESKPKSGVWKEKYIMPLNNDECYTEYACSECHSRFDKKTNYCPNCGSQMEGGE